MAPSTSAVEKNDDLTYTGDQSYGHVNQAFDNEFFNNRNNMRNNVSEI
jgi:hypothetical protein